MEPLTYTEATTMPADGPFSFVDQWQNKVTILIRTIYRIPIAAGCVDVDEESFTGALNVRLFI